MNNIEYIYTLPEISFVGGEKQTLIFNLFTPPPNPAPYNANGCLINFSVINSSNKTGQTVLSKNVTPSLDAAQVYSRAVVELFPLETVHLYGKYIYQLSLINDDDETEIPNQGVMFIVRNINQQFITNNANL